MNITKRNGEVEVYNNEKISIAIKKSFISTGKDISDSEIAGMVSEVEQFIKENPELRTVEDIQNRVEKCLMAHGHYDEAKNYILFRYQRNEQRQAINYIVWTADDRELADVLHSVAREYRERSYSMVTLQEKFSSFTKPGMSQKDSIDALIKAAVELTTPEAPAWEMISARILSYRSEKKITRLEEELGLKTFYRKVKYMTEEGLYGDYILQNYSEEEINEAATFIDPERNKLLNYSGLDLLLKRYVIKNYSGKVIERVQEMFLGIALHLAMPEKEDRLMWVRRIYDLLSKLEVTMATPTLSNSRKPSHQLSSCFIDTVPDSLDGIYRSLDNFSQVSKFGGGMGMYFGKVRATGGNIRGFKGVAGGVIRWMRLVNDTAVAVDQLGMRQGAVAVYLDVWHKDLPEFLQLRTNNGDDRMKAHDIFPAICYPDLFWKMAEEDMNQNWSLFCPNEIMRIKGYCLEDCYGEEWERKYLDCVNDQRLSRRVISIKDIVRLVLRSAVETGTPFTFNRDTVNRANPNAHKGMIYCSNLCTEIAQNMAPIETVSKEVETKDGDTVVVTTTRPGEFVVCNLASLSLGRLPLEDEEKMKEKVATVVRALDNVINLNFYPVPYAQLTNQRYRSIGLGISGYHHALAKRRIKWESEEHLEFMDKVFETINRAAILASSNLAKEKGSYQFFEGSDWQTGIYFDKRGYDSAEWQDVRKTVALQGMRNAYLLAVAPTSSTSIIAGTTAGLDPIMKRFFLEEKKGSMLPRVAPELSDETYWMYKSAYLINQKWSVRASGVRQRHIDQAQSMNLYITNDFTMRQILDLYLLAWKEGVKTIYYVRSKSLEVEECESCSS
ncbi:ribonucleoside-diphosphate reductase subunit alpha [Prevotella melaninogenica]|jgi:ribonucleoside-diphosphate reductase, alpha subunit|uniref:ribonucleoside-diphosphate reductase subunit alpha n=1 Tax=Prevotella TaxID=838 RepID=UPI00044EE963|nr:MULTISPECIES: ribonucleoside-diphosphate reductase subunit alpha [Prevotella]ETS99592.1 ribonucleoside-diphosphate reductase, alpha subunit [Prevotella sp. ICM33]MBF1577463.1 ribonucleoside-diphosphate reductase subunit alpha [Prevotella sp.]MBW4741864.1 ribonucleoside-diphosphate reductase subunit alpha [Prevotella melaninogenica]MBW4912463.1 ribonucleoside-diphosphate reductase subunit alpha [Prevotella melaninogenica]